MVSRNSYQIRKGNLMATASTGCILAPANYQGYKPMYRLHSDNRCPGCHRSHWLVGRLLAECAFCATALPIDDGHVGSSAVILRMDRQGHTANRGAFTINGKS